MINLSSWNQSQIKELVVEQVVRLLHHHHRRFLLFFRCWFWPCAPPNLDAELRRLFSVQARNFATIQSVTGSLLRSVLQSTLTPWTSKTSIFKAKGKPFTISSLLYGPVFRATSFVLNFSKGSVVARRLLLTFLVDLSRLLRIQKRATNKMVGF